MRLCPFLLTVAIPVLASVARADDPAAGRAQLEAGYALKEQGRYAEAMPHLLESLRLYVELKTLTNLADCEEHLEKLVDAQKHWVQARERAAAEGNDKLRDAAASKLLTLEKRMPRLTLKLAPGAPPAVEVIRDGTALGPISLGLPLPTDPGDHTIVVRAKGHADAITHVGLADAEEQEVLVTVGPEVAEPALEEGQGVAAVAPPHRALDTRHVVALATGSAGGASLIVGAIFGIATITTWGNAEANCASGCPSNSAPQTERSHALTYATVSTTGFVAGSALVIAGAVLWLSAPSSQESTRPTGSLGLSSLALAPTWGGFAVRGAF
jgi:hypothetical protein